MVRFLVFTFSTLLLLLLIGIAAVGGIFWYYGRSLPDYGALADYEPPITTRLYAGDGRLMTEYAVEKRVFVPINAIPQKVIAAFLAAEDKSFYTHSGIDPMGLARAVLTNLRNMGSNRRPVGASTITQQVAKNFLLTNEVSIDRKVKEAILAMRIEQTYSKDKILELYLNEIYLGYGSYGVAAAALNYFNKSLDQLTFAEAAYLAALPKAPNNYHPIRKHEAAVERRNWVISRMLEDGHITAEQARDATAAPLQTFSRDETEYVKGGEYFAEEVRRQLITDYGEADLYKGGLVVRTTLDPALQHLATASLRQGLLEYDRRHGWRGPVDHADLPTGSEKAIWLKVLTAVPRPVGALDPWQLSIVLNVEGKNAIVGLSDGSTATVTLSELKWARPWKEKQRLGPEVRKVTDVLALGDVVFVEPMPAEDQDKKAQSEGPQMYLRQIPNVNGGLIALDPHTGRVLAMAGGWSIEASEFNRATQALRQPGSAFKPFVYLSALEHGYTPSTLVLDGPFVYDQGPGMPKWRPKNYSGSYYGPSTLRTGIEKSRNLMTVRLAQAVGMDRIAAKAETFGIDEHFPKLLAASLGAGETTVLRMATAYGMLANGGKRLTPTLIDRIQDRNGRTIYRHDKRACDACADVFWTDQPMPEIPDTREQISDPRSVYQIVHIMEGVITSGTARRLAYLNVPMAGKTGTTNDSVDTWFMGFTPDLVVGVFVGFDEPRTLGSHETGSSTALPVFKAFMDKALKGQAVRPFPVPPGIQFMRVDHATGRFAQPGDTDVISEAFKSGSGPSYVAQTVLDGSAPLDLMGESGETTDDPELLFEEGGTGADSGDGSLNADGSPPAAPPYQVGQPNPYGTPTYPMTGPNDSGTSQPTAGGLY
jgi:penicillin-binding protein 1A